MNYSIISPNKLHEEIAELLEDKNLKMINLDNKDLITYHIEMYIKNSNYINYSNTFDDPDKLFDDICKNLLDTNKEELNTIFIYSNEEFVYEMVYFEYVDNKEYDEDDFNQFASISNIQLLPIYHKCAIMKTNIKNGIKCIDINYKDLAFIVIQNFYNIGLMVNETNEKEITFTTEHPFNVIGNTFIQTKTITIYNLYFMLYEEKCQSLVVNKKISKFFGEEIKGRCFLIMLSPIYFKKIWDLNKNIFNLIVNNLYNDNIEKVLMDKKDENPFVAINKIIG